jgi:hypothetical protein
LFIELFSFLMGTRFATCFRDDFLPLRHSLLRVFPIGLRWGEVEEVTMEPASKKAMTSCYLGLAVEDSSWQR